MAWTSWRNERSHWRWILFTCIILSVSSNAKRVPLLDTTQLPTLLWTTHSASSSAEDGWLEESYTNSQEGSNWRTYVVCDVRRENVDNWVRTPYIQRGDARRLSVEMTFTMRDCKMFPHTARTCKETFTLMAYESEFDFATKELPEWSDRQLVPNGSGYRRIDRITADNGRFTSKDNVVTNVETRIVPVTKKGVYLAFRDEGACISLLAVKVYYEVCEEVVTNFAWFPETAVGANWTSIQETVGHCVDNASPPSPGAQPKYVCKADGTWDLLSGGCQCNPGYRPDGTRCLACGVGFYKDSPGLAGCLPCPSKSASKNAGAAFCECEAGFYRAPSDPKSAPCTRPPSRPIDLKVLKVEQTRAVLSWKQPEDLGGRPTIWYRVECPECPPDTQFLPAKKMFNSTTLTLTNLASASLYTVFVYAENEITPQVDSLPMYAVVDFTTQSSGSSSGAYVVDIRVESVAANELNISWTLPASAYASELIKLKSNSESDHVTADLMDSNQHQSMSQTYYQYAVRLFVKDPATQKRKLMPPMIYRGTANGNNETATTNVQWFAFRGLQANTEYGYQVQVIGANRDAGAWSEIHWTRTANVGGGGAGELSKTSHAASEPLANYILPVVGVIAVAAAIGFVICFLRHRQKPSLCSGEKQPSDLDVLDYKSDPLRSNRHQLHSNSTADYNSAATLTRKIATPLVPPFTSSSTPFHNVFKQYVDPLAYEDPNQVLQEFANEVDRSRVKIEEVIGVGEFGEVCKGKLMMAGGREETVAIKTLKPGSSDKAKADFLTEASIMGQFDHPNVIKLKGVVTKSETVMIITEYMENRSLDAFLKLNDGRLDVIQLVSMLHGIASGMKYLSDKGFVHRDLAARNVLVDASFSCKIADFGLSRGTEGSIEQAYTTKGGKIPVRWTAPEAIAYRKFTSSSDVWSFGVVMWEVMSYGERPYWDWSNQDVIKAIEQDYRLPPPMDCPKALHDLMLQCWQKERQNRPTFPGILQTLQSYLRCPDLLYASSSISSISSPLGVSHSGGSLASLTSSAVLPSLCAGIGLGESSGGGHPSTRTSSGFVSAAASGAGAYQSTNPSSPTRSLMSQMTLENFLRDLALDRFITVFHRHGCRNITDLARLTFVDMASFGLQTYEQNKIRDAMQRLHISSSYYPHKPSFQAPQHVVPCTSSANEGFFV